MTGLVLSLGGDQIRWVMSHVIKAGYKPAKKTIVPRRPALLLLMPIPINAWIRSSVDVGDRPLRRRLICRASDILSFALPRCLVSDAGERRGGHCGKTEPAHTRLAGCVYHRCWTDEEQK